MTENLENELNAVLSCVALFPDGAPFKQISQNLSPPLHQRTLQRRLATLVKKNLLKVHGSSRSRVYQLTLPLTQDVPTNTTEVLKDDILPLSAKSKEIEKCVIQPIQARMPVSYNREFLEEYRPNSTHYLDELTLQKLEKLGKTDGERVAGTFVRQIFNRLLIDLSWNSSRLEGNTYSLLETERLLKLQEIVEGKDLKEAKMILNHKEAIEFLVESATDIGINRFTILNLHALLSNDLLGDLEACGRLRSIPFGISKSVYQPLSVPQLIEEYFQQILDTASAIKNPFEQAFFLMVHLPYLQPFEDVNKRVSRLAANIPLIQNNLCPLSFIDVPQSTYVNGLLGIYELNRFDLLKEVFVWSYERSCARYSATKKELGEPDPFRIRYKTLITEAVCKVVRNQMDKTKAVAAIKEFANEFIPIKDRAPFIESTEKDLMGLHEGNIARHKLRLSEYQVWHDGWK